MYPPCVNQHHKGISLLQLIDQKMLDGFRSPPWGLLQMIRTRLELRREKEKLSKNTLKRVHREWHSVAIARAKVLTQLLPIKAAWPGKGRNMSHGGMIVIELDALDSSFPRSQTRQCR